MKVYAVDFDGTLCTEAYPEIGKPIHKTIALCNKLQREGHKLILWTCREGEKLQEAIDFCRQYGLTFDAVNANLPERVKQYNADPRKVGADYYIDDRNILPQSL